MSLMIFTLCLFIVLPSPSSYCSPHDGQINGDMSCWDKEYRLYSESQQMENMVDSCPKEPSCLSQNSGFFYTKTRGNKVKHFLVLVSLWRGCVHFFLPAVIQRWVWSRCFLCSEQRYFSLMFITWEAGFPEMDHYV